MYLKNQPLPLLLFNIVLYDLLYFLEDTDICNFADDITTYICDKK